MKQINHVSLVHKYLSDDLSTTEREAYDSWVAIPGNNKVVEDLSRIWDLSADYQPTSFQPNAALAFNKFKQEISNSTVDNAIPVIADRPTSSIPVIADRPMSSDSSAKIIKMNPMKWVGRIAASMVFIAASFFLLKDIGTNNVDYNQQFAATSIEKTSLEDGSIITMDAGSLVSLASDYGQSDRKVKLEGKAFFDVERMEDKPFIVDMGGSILEVLGTSFNIDNTSENVVVEVKTGLVKVSTETQSATLKAGQSAVINYNEDNITVGENAQESFDWYAKQLAIKNMPIEEAFAKIANYYDVEIDLAANVDKTCPLTSPLAASSSIDDLMEVLSVAYSMQYQKINNQKYLIKLLDCKK
jgi:ferric-dicitrate binding protein FerR (iron transport regulator)